MWKTCQNRTKISSEILSNKIPRFDQTFSCLHRKESMVFSSVFNVDNDKKTKQSETDRFFSFSSHEINSKQLAKRERKMLKNLRFWLIGRCFHQLFSVVLSKTIGEKEFVFLQLRQSSLIQSDRGSCSTNFLHLIFSVQIAEMNKSRSESSLKYFSSRPWEIREFLFGDFVQF